MQCKAKSKQSGEQCKRSAVPGKSVCNIHGGKTPHGFDLPQTKTGRYSKYAPTKLLAIYDDVQADPELLSVRHDIHLIDALLNFKLQQLFDADGERHADSFEAWKVLRGLVADARKAYKSESYAGLEKALDEMEAVADLRLYRYAAEQEIKSDIEQRRKLVETEQKITLQGERAVSAESVMLLMAQVLEVIKTVVTDDRQRFAIATGLQSLISIPTSGSETD